jgi:formylglycine-generating enzyme
MVNLGTFCIDSTEITNAEYAAFLTDGVSTTGQPAYCSANTGYTPSSGWPAPPAAQATPVVYVDWCDADAYCRWAGKHLCGKIGGGANPTSSWSDATSSQWLAACSAGGTKPWPYGAPYQSTYCNGVDRKVGAPAALTAGSMCEGGVPGLFDMSGNVWEWEGSCSASSGQLDRCMVRGGSYLGTSEELRCDGAGGRMAARLDTAADRGFRCCWD